MKAYIVTETRTVVTTTTYGIQAETEEEAVELAFEQGWKIGVESGGSTRFEVQQL